MSSNSSWLEAYEAQKAKALQRLEANKNGQSNVTGLSGSSGIVDTKEVSGFTRQTKVTKLLSNMKLPDPPPRKREAAPVDNKSTTKEQQPMKKIKSNATAEADNQMKLASIPSLNPAPLNHKMSNEIRYFLSIL